MLSPTTSQLLQAFFATSYVSSIYVHPDGRLKFEITPRGKKSPTRTRNDPLVIRTRLTAVVLATIVSCVVVITTVFATLPSVEKTLPNALTQAWSLLGLKPSFTTPRIILPYLLVPVLYSGPLFTSFLASALPFQRKFSFELDVVNTYSSLQGLRNYIIAPITEEIVFRACILSVSRMAGASWQRMIFVTPLWFGVAHAHHAWEGFNMYGGTQRALGNAVATSIIQLCYTTLFGWYTSFVFLRTRSIYAVCAAHMFCNFVGLPTISGDLKDFPRHKLMIWCSHIGGIVGFFLLLGPWTAGL
ncbi:uncharacterized protein EI90DRAFT_3282145 [Cantharellus anzutake]|uniref:uncharacterized protein n=1 Tax=Cantharellus anzutake TaxID=1750568 RepID=UPI001905B4B3|nr:uncharacterized protein EI90DRAFT_3282145 [Cantharellus anzutake]KAF8323006.1 hypothetical protein EI90DRAFT_3282145 [Cantharellus anzutake]